MNSIAIFCGSQSGASPVYRDGTRQLGQFIVQNKMTLIYGGGQVGLMGVLANSVLEQGGEVIGVIPKALFGKELAHKKLSKLHLVNSMHERKQLMYTLADGFMALPGGLGTLDELFEVLTWAQLGLHHKPCALLNMAGYFDALLKMLDQACEQGFIKGDTRQMILTSANIQDLLSQMQNYQPPQTEKWITNEQT